MSDTSDYVDVYGQVIGVQPPINIPPGHDQTANKFQNWTPDPFGQADSQAYNPADYTPSSGVDLPYPQLPPWSRFRAPGTVRSIAPRPIIPLDPWAPDVALLNANQLAAINSYRAARQAAAQYTDNPRAI